MLTTPFEISQAYFFLNKTKLKTFCFFFMNLLDVNIRVI
jgi:hypothetical protein